jgi:hypothetical protein
VPQVAITNSSFEDDRKNLSRRQDEVNRIVLLWRTADSVYLEFGKRSERVAFPSAFIAGNESH